MADDLGWGDVGFNGNTRIRTPELDAMAKHGLVLRRFYAAAPVCSPTRGSALTGRHPFRYGILTANSGHIRAGESTLAELLKPLGYATGHFGKWHLGTLTKQGRDSNRGGDRNLHHFAPPWLNGFDICFSTEAKVPTYDPLLQPLQNRSRTWWDPVKSIAVSESYGTAYWNASGMRVTDGMRGDDSKLIMDRAIPFLESAAADKQPFFAVIWFHAPHLPVVAGPEHTRHYANLPGYQKHYYGCVTALDEQMGRLRAKLRQLDVAENTMVWFCSDNGPEGQSKTAPGSAGPFRGRKRDLYEGGIRVPAIVEWPRVVKQGVTEFPASTVDYVPTILNALALDGSQALQPQDGQSLIPLLRGKSMERRPMGFESAGQVVWMDERYKLIRRPGKKGRRNQKSEPTDSAAQTARGPAQWELYDLSEDPGEQIDLAEQDPKRVQSMVAALERWRKSCQASRSGQDYPNGESSR